MKAKEKVEHTFRTAAEMAADASGEKGEPIGLHCPRCWCRRSHVDTTRPAPGEIRRYRVCMACGTRWRTEER